MAKRKSECTPEEWERQKEMSRARNKRYLDAHKDEATFKARIKRNAEIHRAKVKDTEEYKEKAKKRASKWFLNNKERSAQSAKEYRKNNVEKLKLLDAKKYANNKEMYKKRAREREQQMPRRSLGGYYKEEIAAIYKKAKELTKETGIPHEVDHIVPLNGKLVSGLHVPANLQIITMTENRQKSNKFIGEVV